jgi:hypothetical protein
MEENRLAVGEGAALAQRPVGAMQSGNRSVSRVVDQKTRYNPP